MLKWDCAGCQLVESRRVLFLVVGGVHCCPLPAVSGRCGLCFLGCRDATTGAGAPADLEPATPHERLAESSPESWREPTTTIVDSRAYSRRCSQSARIRPMVTRRSRFSS